MKPSGGRNNTPKPVQTWQEPSPESLKNFEKIDFLAKKSIFHLINDENHENPARILPNLAKFWAIYVPDRYPMTFFHKKTFKACFP